MKRVAALCTTLAYSIVFAQNEYIDLEAFAERLFQVQDENINYEDIYESLLVHYTNRLNLNKAGTSELASLYILSPLQINSFFEYRDQFGKLLSINELQVIPGFDVQTIRNLKPFVTVKEAVPTNRPFFRRMLEEENNYLLLRWSRTIESRIGYTLAFPPDTAFVRNELNQITDTVTAFPQRYNGSPNKIYGRFRVNRPGDFSFGFTFEKDEGETVAFTKNQAGFDFYSYHLMLENKFGFKRVIIGDYQIQVGQSVVLGAGFNAGKGAETVNAIKRNSLGALPYTSVLEDGFFRGVCIAKEVNRFEITGFYSRQLRDGTIRSDTTFSDVDEFVNSIQNTGLHRTPNEVAMKNQLSETSIGGVVQYQPHRRLSVGLSGLYTGLSKPILPRPNNYNQFEFRGTYNYVSSSYFHYTWENFTFFGEGAISRSGGKGAIMGLVTSLSATIDLALTFRNYDRDFHSFYGNALSESARTINEKGTYWGLSFRPGSKHTLNMYYDFFRFPWLRFRTEAPSIGNEWLVRYSYSVNKQTSFYIQTRSQLRQVTIPKENLNILTDQIRNNYAFNIDYQVEKGLSFKTKIQSSTQDQDGAFSKGFAVIQDINFQVWQLRFNTRLALFDTDNFNNAQYVYEKDVLYAFAIPAYNGTGVRNYLMVRYDPSRKLSFWFRYAQFSFRNIESIGTGLDRIDSRTLSEIKVMTRIKF